MNDLQRPESMNHNYNRRDISSSVFESFSQSISASQSASQLVSQLGSKPVSCLGFFKS